MNLAIKLRSAFVKNVSLSGIRNLPIETTHDVFETDRKPEYWTITNGEYTANEMK